MKYPVLICAASVALLSSCGGGGGGGSTGTASTATPSYPQPVSGLSQHSIQLGPIVGASVTIFRPDCSSAVYQTTTDDNGNYSINISQLKAALGASTPELLCVQATGGKDVDPNDDGIRDPKEAVALQGKIRGFVLTEDLLTTSGTRINLFGTAVADLLAVTADLSIARIEQLAQQLRIPDIDGDGKITIRDLTRYEMGSQPSAETELRESYLRAVYSGDDSSRSAYADYMTQYSSAVRAEFIPQGSASSLVKLIPFGKSTTLRYGSKLETKLANVYSAPFLAPAQSLFYIQECSATDCTPTQAIQVDYSGTRQMLYSDTGGVDLTGYAANVRYRSDLQTKINDTKASIDKVTVDWKQASDDAAAAKALVSSIEAQNQALKAELAQLQSP